MALLAAAVGYALPSVRDAPRRLPVRVYQALTLVGAGLVAACVAVFGITLEGLAASVFCLALAFVTATDLEYRLIPNRVVLPASVLALAAMTAAEPSPEWAIAALGASLFLFVAALVHPAGMGMGDVKLALLMGAVLGRAVVPALVIATLAAAVPAIVLLLLYGRAGGKKAIPFGPFLALGSVIALFAQA